VARELGAPTAAAWLRGEVARLPRAAAALALLEEGSAALACPAGFRFIPRRDAISLGSDVPRRKNPVHVASTAPFYLATNETTNAEFAAFVEGGGYARRELFTEGGWARRETFHPTGEPAVFAPLAWAGGKLPAGRETRPVSGVSFAEALAFARFAGARLPSADEWEVAAGARPDGGVQSFPWGETFDDKIAPADATEAREVGALDADASPWGVHDMGGNVQEWVVETGADDKVVAVLKGGSWKLGRYRDEFRVDRRARPLPSRFDDVGFRLARDVPLVDLGALEER
jgi:formylglycine-generating enzyme required for sulfatase activity